MKKIHRPFLTLAIIGLETAHYAAAAPPTRTQAAIHDDVAPVASDAGNNVELVTVTAKSRKTDRAGFANASKGSGQTFKLTSTQTQTRITQREVLEASIPVGTITNAMANLPNVTLPTTTSPLVGGNIYIRGFGKSLLNVTLDGIPMNLISDYSVYANQLIPLSLIGGIDVKPGPGAASTLGYSNFGGSVDVLSANPTSRPAAVLEAGVGSFAEQKYGATFNTGEILHNTTTFVVSLNHQRADGYFDRGADGHAVQSGRVPVNNQIGAKLVSHVGSGTLTGLYDFNNQLFSLVQGATSSQIARFGPAATVYTGPEKIATYWRNNIKKSHSSIGYLDYAMPIGSIATVSERPYYADGYSYVSSVPTARPYSTNYSQQGLRQYFRYGSTTKLNIDPARWIDIEGGAWYDYTRYTSSIVYGAFNKALPVRPDSAHIVDKVTTVQPYLQAVLSAFDRLTITPGIKYNASYRQYRDLAHAGGYDKSWFNFLPSLGINIVAVGTKEQPILSVYGNYTRSFEPPSYSQISLAAQNFSLLPQYADSFEAGPIWSVGRWTGKISLFDTHFLNYLRPINVSNAANPNGITAYANACGATYQGVDINNAFALNKKLSAFLNIGLLDAHFSSVSTPIAYAPHNTDALGLRWQGADLQAGVSFQYNSGYFLQTTANTYHRNTPFFTSNLFASYKLPIKVTHLSDAVVSLNLDNAFNRTYIVDAGSYLGQATYNYALPINVFADIKIRFD